MIRNTKKGDLFYYVVPVADEDVKARHTAVLGWELSPGSHPGRRWHDGGETAQLDGMACRVSGQGVSFSIGAPRPE